MGRRKSPHEAAETVTAAVVERLAREPVATHAGLEIAVRRLVEIVQAEPELLLRTPRQTPSDAAPPTSAAPLEGRQRYEDRESKKENVVEFLRRVYRDLIEHQKLIFCDIKKYDFPLYVAIQNYKKRQPLPDDIRLWTKKDITDFYLAQDALGLPIPAEMADRLRSARHDRKRRGKDPHLG